MAQLPSNFNPKDHKPMGDFSAFEPCDVIAVISSSAKQESKSTPGNFYWKLEFDIIDGPHKGRKLWTNLNLINSNPSAVERANSELTSICESCGIYNVISDTAELHGIPMVCHVGIEPQNASNPARNKITGYDAAAGYEKPATPSAAAATASAPAGGKKKRAWEE